MKKLILVLTLVLFTITFLSGDIYVKTKTHTDAMKMMGTEQPAKDEIIEQWIGNNIFTNITKKLTTIIDLSKNMLYMLMHDDKTYIETTLPLDMKKFLPPEVAGMMGMMKLTLKVTPTNETKVIKGWKCVAYDMDMSIMMMQMKSKIWVTKDVSFDWKKYQEKFGIETFKSAMASMQISDDVINEFKKIQGFQVKTDMTMTIMGQNVKITSEVLEITKKSVPAGVYKIPADYKKTSKLSMGSLKK